MGKLVNMRTCVLAVIVVLPMTSACRNRKRSEKVGAEALRVLVTLNGMDDAHKGDASLQYSLKCGGDWTQGNLVANTESDAEFFIAQAREGDSCEAKVSMANPSDILKFLKDPGVLYGSGKTVTLGTKAGGILGAQALMVRYYTASKSDGSLTVPVRFKEELPEKTGDLVASFNCTPKFEASTKGLKGSDKTKRTGKFIFTNGIVAGSYKCTDFYIAREGLSFHGPLDETFVLNTEPKTAKEIEVSKLTVETSADAIIIFKPGEKCGADQIFNIETRKCETRPK